MRDYIVLEIKPLDSLPRTVTTMPGVTVSAAGVPSEVGMPGVPSEVGVPTTMPGVPSEVGPSLGPVASWFWAVPEFPKYAGAVSEFPKAKYAGRAPLNLRGS